MHFFEKYIEPLTVWLHLHPDAALFITFLLAFAESLAIIGSVIPGSITMTAIGILAGSGIFRIDLTMLMASLGAVAGDGASYLLGYYYRERLSSIWPFNHYPNLLAYGQIYFEKHGGKSILIGRFAGPLRSIIPVIAGMLAMPKMQFFIANVISGIAWAFLYVTPGVLIGTASHELSPEKAAQFVLFILLGLVVIWVVSIIIKSLFLRFRNWFDINLNFLWTMLLKTPYIGILGKFVTPSREIKHTNTALLVIIFLFNILFLLLLTKIHYHSDKLFLLNQPIHLCIQSIRTNYFDMFFSIAHQLMTFIPVFILFFFMLSYFLFKRDFYAAILFSGIIIFSGICVYLYQHILHSAANINPDGILENINDSFYPFRAVCLSAVVYFSVFYNNYLVKLSFSRKLFAFLLLVGFLCAGFSFIYLGDLWLTDLVTALVMGFNLSIIYAIFYRKRHLSLKPSAPLFSTIGFLLFILSGTLVSFLHAEQTFKNHQIYFSQHIISQNIWWDQEEVAVLPLYSNNRLGRVSSVFNIQYVGKLGRLRLILEKNGWKNQKRSILDMMIKKRKNQNHFENPLANSLYLYQKPTLTLVFYPEHSAVFIRIQLWRSNYYLTSFKQPIWLGHAQVLNRSLNKPLYAQDPALFILKKHLSDFTTKLIPLPTDEFKPNSLIKANYILLVDALSSSS